VAAPAATSASAHHTIRRESHTDLNRSTIRVAPFPNNTHTHPSNYTAHHTRTKMLHSFHADPLSTTELHTPPFAAPTFLSFGCCCIARACEPPRRPINIYLTRLLCRGATRSTPLLPFRNRICRRLTPLNNRNTQSVRPRQRPPMSRRRAERSLAAQLNHCVPPLLLLSAGREPVVVGTTIPRTTGCGKCARRSSLAVIYARVHTPPSAFSHLSRTAL
jgi:hypothetical protein